MKYFKIFTILLFIKANVFSQKLTIVDQDYAKAKAIALRDNKLILIDFYTTWCAPCKKLDKLIFQNDTLQQKLAKDFILLKYDAEKDSVFNLSKKHHIVSYPTGIILSKDGYVINQKYGFNDDDLETLEKSFFGFANEGIQFSKENKILKGYSNKIETSKYPQFYINTYNKKKVDTIGLKSYWKTKKDIFSEQYFSVVLYYAQSLPDIVSNSLLKNKTKYEELYGELDMSFVMFLLSAGKFEKAILTKNQNEFDEAIVFTNKANKKESAEQIVKMFNKRFLISQNKWSEVFKINETLKNNNQFSDDAVNSFSWDVYEKCNDQTVITKCVQWMKELVNKKPEYANLDTYACILFKSGDKVEAKKIAEIAIETGKKNNENTKSTERLLKSLQ